MENEQGELKRYMILPAGGLFPRSPAETDALLAISRGDTGHPAAKSFPWSGSGRLIDECVENGMKLAWLTEAEAEALNADSGPLRAVREHGFTHRPRHRLLPVRPPAAVAVGPPPGVEVTLTCVDAASGAPVPDCHVFAVTDAANGVVIRGRTDAAGVARLQLDKPLIEQLYIYKDPGYWGAYRTDIPIAAGDDVRIPIEPISLTFVDPVQYYYGNSCFDGTAGVLVGLVDTGVGPRAELNVSGLNLVPGEPPDDFFDVEMHGTFCAGLIGSGSAPPTGMRGIAPGVAMRAYRVFNAAMETTDYLVIKGLLTAAAERCDIVNLALGAGLVPNPDFASAIEHLRESGILVIGASGNGFRKPVDYPGRYPGVVAAGSLGRIGTFPPGSVIDADIAYPPRSGAEPDEFIGGFSNIGPEVKLTGLGSGLVSTLPNSGFGAWSGSSVSVPVITGAMACLLSQHREVLAMPRDRARSDAMEQILLASCAPRGFGADYEGHGLPMVS